MPITTAAEDKLDDHLSSFSREIWLDITQGSHRLEKNLNIRDCLEKSLKIKFALNHT